jgi:hypothetical protein
MSRTTLILKCIKNNIASLCNSISNKHDIYIGNYNDDWRYVLRELVRQSKLFDDVIMSLDYEDEEKCEELRRFISRLRPAFLSRLHSNSLLTSDIDDVRFYPSIFNIYYIVIFRYWQVTEFSAISEDIDSFNQILSRHEIKYDHSKYYNVESKINSSDYIKILDLPDSKDFINLVISLYEKYKYDITHSKKLKIDIPSVKQLPIKDELKIEQKKKKNIPKSVKNKVWINYIGEEFRGSCFCCKRNIDVFNFIAGHVQSSKEGGSNEIDNLRPICLSCNSSMRSQNMFEFMKENGL